MDGRMKGEGVTNMFNRRQVPPAAMHTHEYLRFRGNINQQHVYSITAFRAQTPSWKIPLMNNGSRKVWSEIMSQQTLVRHLLRYRSGGRLVGFSSQNLRSVLMRACGGQGQGENHLWNVTLNVNPGPECRRYRPRDERRGRERDAVRRRSGTQQSRVSAPRDCTTEGVGMVRSDDEDVRSAAEACEVMVALQGIPSTIRGGA
ncbi:60S ribosomal protein L17 [Clarias magur]|uniref:60S ribosomal protein L17 n=1 Tax=Clarias magur TaxID=1594786 RepID=A0A8J4TQN8_CLAMG|nr:60S ribosomal protein L17 [Clarias magur]